MRVLTITANDNGIGGASRIAMESHKAYAAAGHDVSMLVGKRTSTDQAVQELRRPLWRKALSYLLANDFDYFDGSQILEAPQFRDADVVHCHNLNGWYFNLPTLIEMGRQKPVVWTLHDMWAITPHSAHTDSRKLQNGLLTLSDPSLYPATLWNNDRWLARRKTQIYRALTAHVVTPCSWLASLVSQTSLASQPLSVIYNGTNLSPFLAANRSGAKERVGLDERPLALFVGAAATSNPFKGFGDFEWLANSKTDCPIQFVCLGVEEDVTRAGMRVMRSTRDRQRIAAVMAAADVLVVPSRHEVLPTVIIEAMACGTPTVAYNVGGISEMFTGDLGGTVVPPQDRLGLREAVIKTALRPLSAQAEFSTRLRRHAKNSFGVDRMASQYIELFESLLSQRGALAS